MADIKGTDDDDEKAKIEQFLNEISGIPSDFAPKCRCHKEKEAIKFLRARRMCVSRAVTLYRQYNRMRYTEKINKIDPCEPGVHRELLSQKFTVLPGRDNDGAAILLFTAHLHSTTVSIQRDVLKGVLLQLDAATQNPLTQINGMSFIYDMTDSRYSNFDHDLCLKMLNLLKGAYPARIQKIIIVSAPLWFKMPFGALRLFLEEKMRDRVFLVESEQLCEHISVSVLPKSLGGSLEINHHDWLSECFAILGLTHRIGPDYFQDIHTMPSVYKNRQRLYTSIRRPRRASSFNHLDEDSEQSNHLITRSSSTTRRPSNYLVAMSPILRENSLSHRHPNRHCRVLEDDCLVSNNNVIISSSSIVHLDDNLSNSVAKTDYNVVQSDKTTIFSRLEGGMTVKQFAEYVYNLGEEGLTAEYRAKFGNRNTEDISAFKQPQNKSKNRYVDVPCLESSRVELPNGAYIHANWVDGYKQSRAFLCTQGPLPNTCEDFWMMIWHYTIPIIVMTTKTFEGRRQKCHQYWPENEGASESFGQFTIINKRVESNDIYIKSTLQLRKKSKSQDANILEISHFYFISWPDFGIPDNPQNFLQFVHDIGQLTDQIEKNGTGKRPPVLVHCSAGIGRTGTFIAMDICIRRLNDVGRIDFVRTVELLRIQRAGSIQMPQQYVFCHYALIAYAQNCHLLD